MKSIIITKTNTRRKEERKVDTKKDTKRKKADINCQYFNIQQMPIFIDTFNHNINQMLVTDAGALNVVLYLLKIRIDLSKFKLQM